MASLYEVNRRRSQVIRRAVLVATVISSVASALAGIWLSSGRWGATAGVLALTAFVFLPALVD